MDITWILLGVAVVLTVIMAVRILKKRQKK